MLIRSGPYGGEFVREMVIALKNRSGEDLITKNDICILKLAYVYFFKISRGLGVGGDDRPSQNEGLREFKSPQIRSLCLKFGLYDKM